MEYKSIAKLSYMSDGTKDKAWREEIAAARRNESSSFDLGIDTSNGPLFVAVPKEMLVLYERILRTERKVSGLVRPLPGIAYQELMRSLVLDEVISTNAIEDIHSTGEQILEALKSYSEDEKSYKRFSELAHLYLGLQMETYELPETSADIRAIYDKVVDGELSPEKVPDGALFRASGVQVTAGGVKAIHNGVEPESKIIESLEAMLNLVKREDVPEILSAIASHYVFEYIHPFYDGNGRTGRYLLSLFLSNTLSAATVISLSRAIAENLNAYYAAFKSTEDPLNMGEVTFFVYSMLELIRTAQLKLIDEIEKRKSQLESVKLSLDALVSKNRLNDVECQILYVMAQYELFGMYGEISLTELAEHTRHSKNTVRKYVSKLVDSGMVVEISPRPLQFSLSEKGASLLGIVDELSTNVG